MKKSNKKKHEIWSNKIKCGEVNPSELPDEVLADEELSFTLCVEAVLANPEGTLEVPIGVNLEKVYMMAIKKEYNLFEKLPDEKKTPFICLIAAEEVGYNLQYVPEDLRTDELYEVALTSTPSILGRLIQKERMTEKMWSIAVSNGGCSLSDIPEHMRTEKVFDEALSVEIRKNIERIFVDGGAFLDENDHINNFPDEGNWRERYINKSIEKYSYMLIDKMDDSHKTLRVWEIAVARNPNYLEQVPDDLKTVEMCEQAVLRQGNTLRYVPNEIRVQICH